MSGQRQLPRPTAQRGQRTHAPGGLDETAQVSYGHADTMVSLFKLLCLTIVLPIVHGDPTVSTHPMPEQLI